MAVLSGDHLGKAQIKALKELGEPGHFRVNWRPNLSPDGYAGLRDGGYIEEHWTWASVSRPDVGITEKGVAALSQPLGDAEPDCVAASAGGFK